MVRLFLFGLFVSPGAPALAQLEPAKKLCTNWAFRYPADDVIFGCTAVIEDEKASVEDRTLGYSVRGVGLAMKGDFDAAFVDLDKAVDLSPNSPEPYARRGAALHYRGELDQAIADYGKALALNSNYALPLAQRGGIYLMRGEHDKAVADLTAAIKLTPQDAAVYVGRGEAYQAKGSLDLAVADFAKAVQLDQKRPEYVNALGFAHYIKGDFKSAIPYLRATVETKNQAYVVLLRYLAQKRVGEPAATAELEQNLAGLQSKEWPYAVAELYLSKHPPAEIFKVAEKPEQQCEAHFYTGEWHILKGEAAKAALELKVAVDTCPKTFIEYAAARTELQRLKR
jgi:Flp pilus assembly protein TadD